MWASNGSLHLFRLVPVCINLPTGSRSIICLLELMYIAPLFFSFFISCKRLVANKYSKGIWRILKVFFIALRFVVHIHAFKRSDLNSRSMDPKNCLPKFHFKRFFFERDFFRKGFHFVVHQILFFLQNLAKVKIRLHKHNKRGIWQSTHSASSKLICTSFVYHATFVEVCSSLGSSPIFLAWGLNHLYSKKFICRG